MTRRAIAAAVDAGRAAGLDVREPRVLHDAFSVVVHLAPAPVVARVPVLLHPLVAADLDRRFGRLQAELDVAAQLAAHGLPVVTPSLLVPCEPVVRDGHAMTFWTYVPGVDGTDVPRPDRAATLGPALAGLHAELRRTPDVPDFLAPVGPWIPAAFEHLATRPGLLPRADADRGRREWAVLEPALSSGDGFAAAFPGAGVQPIHGDARFANLLRTPAGVLWSDFEFACTGPVEWDLAIAGPAAAAAYAEAAAAYGLRVPDPRVTRALAVARLLLAVADLVLVADRPELLAGQLGAVDTWRAEPELTAL